MNSKKMQELSPEMLSQVSGGYVVEDTEHHKYWIVRQDGTVVAPVETEAMAVDFAKALSTSTEILTMEEYKEKFGRDLVW